MRDEGRIMPLVMQVGRLWQYYCPDLRFMQLMSNFADWYGADPFYMEDDEFLAKFKEYMTEMDYIHAPQSYPQDPRRSLLHVRLLDPGAKIFKKNS